jgi:hypothetical protein
MQRVHCVSQNSAYISVCRGLNDAHGFGTPPITKKRGALHIVATPYCACIDPVTALYTVKPAPPAALALRASRVVFDDFTEAAAAAAAPIRAGKRPGAGGARLDHIAEQGLLGAMGRGDGGSSSGVLAGG